MKVMIASDLHGSSYFANKLVEIKQKEGVDKLILLGDIFNHGPRNPFPNEYAPMTVADILNGIKDELIVVKGNCDSQVDTLISEFDFIEDMCLFIGGKSIFLTHGHVYNKDKMPKTKFDAMIYGHFHTGFIEKIGETVVANAGSIALPKGGTPSSYIIIDENEMILKDVDGKVIKSEII